jgi:TRAP-type uncharacterized transport system substrate-binding protein
MRKLLPALGVCVSLLVAAQAQADTKPIENVIGLLAGEVEWLPQAGAIASDLAHEDGLRILPIMGAGSVQALQDLAQLPNVDAAIVSSDSLFYARQQKLLEGNDTKFNYVARLGPLDVVLIATRGINNVTALAGKRIATGPVQSAGFSTGELLFGAFEIPFTRVPVQGNAAIEALIDNKADAALVLGTDIPKAALSDGRFHVLALPLPPSLAEIYQPAILTSATLPGLLNKGASVETVAASLTLAVFDWPQGSSHYESLRHFETQLFKLQNGSDANNLAADVAGWKRHSSASDTLGNVSSTDNSGAIITPTGGEP